MAIPKGSLCQEWLVRCGRCGTETSTGIADKQDAMLDLRIIGWRHSHNGWICRWCDVDSPIEETPTAPART